MLSLPARNQQGFTLIESAIIVLIVGIIGAITLPNFFSFLNARRVDQGLDTLESALKQIQLEAVRQSRNCDINIPTGNSPTITSGTGTNNCLRIGSQTLTGINLASSAATITYDFKGRPTAATVPAEQTIVLSLTTGDGPFRCLVIAPGIGISRTGTYNGAGTVANNCITPQQ